MTITPTAEPEWLANWIDETGRSVVYRDRPEWTGDAWVVVAERSRRGGQLSLNGPGLESDTPLIVEFLDQAQLAGDWPRETTFRISTDARSRQLRVDGDLVGPTFVGHVDVLVSGQLDRPKFVREHGRAPAVTLTGRGRVFDATGSARVTFKTSTVLSGAVEEPLIVLGVSHRQNAQRSGELDWVDIYKVGWEGLQGLERLDRLQIAWPMRRLMGLGNRRTAIKRATEMDMGSSDKKVAARRRFMFWERLVRALRDQGVGGRTEAVAREVAYETRRRAASKTSPEYWLLALSRLFGHGTRLGRPLFVWLVVALLATLLLFQWQAVGDLFSMRVAALTFDLFFTPVSFIRGADSPLLEPMWDSGFGNRAVITGMRIVGVTCIAYLAVAIRAYTRI